MRKVLLALMAITLLLSLTSLAITNQNLTPSPINENKLASNALKESSGKIEENTQAPQTSTQPNSGDQTVNLDTEKTAEPNQNMGNQNPAEECNFQKEDIQTLEDSAQNQNSNSKNLTPPDGRIYYPTSSEEPYAYTPTYTPKEANMPIIPTISQD